ncbi:MAG: GntR family transcriptional regulator [Bacillota bacterium]
MRDRRPLYTQVAEKIRSEFSVSSPSETVRLPGEMALAERYQVSRTTIREAHRLLEQEGTIFARHGVGTFLSSQSKGTTYTFDTLSPGASLIRTGADDLPAVLMGCTMLPLSRTLRTRFGWPGDTLLRLERLRKRNLDPISYSVDVVPAAFVGGSVEEGSFDKPLHELLSDGGFGPHHTDSILTAVMAPARVRKEMPGLAGQPVIRSQDVFFDTKGQVLAICLQYLEASSLYFRIRRRAF